MLTDKTKVSLFLEPATACNLKVLAARYGCRGVSELIEKWVEGATSQTPQNDNKQGV